jgi:hypothetical protein
VHCENLVEHGNTTWLTFEYDVKVVVPLLMVCFYNWLNLTTIVFVTSKVDVVGLELEENMFVVGT